MATSIVANRGDGSYTVAFDDGYYIVTTLTASGDKVDRWLGEIYRKHHSRLVVGLDVEWRPPSPFVRGTEPPVAVLQICVGCRCLVFQILRADYVPGSLVDFLADDRFTFVGVGIDDDVAKLRRYGLEVKKVEDLRYLAANTLGKPDLRKAGLQTLVREVLGVRLEKPLPVRISAWDAPRLSPEQLRYACVDAFASSEVGRRLYDGEYMGVRLEKPLHVRTSAWDAPRLSPEQLQYACVDAFASSEVGRRLYDGEYASTRFPRLSPEQLQYARVDAFASSVGRRLHDSEYTSTRFRIYCLRSIATLGSIAATTIFLATILSFGVVCVLAYPTS